ncbi:hypothetical protein DAT299_16830 [Streptococcus suis]|uniref:hypothetical protein n=1 Tax=Streptococcus suis TaxID=1307 RepID=UPI00032A4461|nr:hypothetical protein [Streptococcus suis]AGL48619.1 hypothetical protein TL13_1694 [Streptococcus suis TL13]BCK44119.1 hypothetical protein DAT299_16830 [Streptococcus suis]
MNKKNILTSFTLLVSTVLLFACQSNESTTKSSEKIVETSSSSKDAISEEQRNKWLKEFYEEVAETDGSNYHNDIEERSQKAWNENQTNIFNGQASLNVTNDYLPSELTKLNVTIDGYDEATRRLKVTVTNNYDETLIGTTTNSNNNNLYGTYFTLYGYTTLSGRSERVKIAQIALVSDLPAGESIKLEILPSALANPQSDYAKKFQNSELDSKYYLLSTNYGNSLWDITKDQVMGEEIISEQIVLSSLANIYIVPKLVFETYPSTAPNDSELENLISNN